MDSYTEYCAAKINLTLHITGKRDDGYHLLNSQVAFANDVYDVLNVRKSQQTQLIIAGEFAKAVPEDNSVLKAIRWLETHHKVLLPVDVQLTKNIPAQAGLGGGSANAAGIIRAIERLYNLPVLPPEQLLVLGADVPVCYHNKHCTMQGIGEKIISDAYNLPEIITLINPGVTLPTNQVFQNICTDDYKNNTIENHLLRSALKTSSTFENSFSKLKQCVNERIYMTGSGSTLFIKAALAKELLKVFPEWWIYETTLH